MSNSLRKWMEGLDPLGDPGYTESPEGLAVGNLGAKVVGTLVAWTQPDGFFRRVKNQELLVAGAKSLQELLRKFFRMSSRLVVGSHPGAREMKELQSPWFFTLGNRLAELDSTQGSVREKALRQLGLLAERLEKKWNQFLATNTLGIRVNDPGVLPEPPGSRMAPETPTDL